MKRLQIPILLLADRTRQRDTSQMPVDQGHQHGGVTHHPKAAPAQCCTLKSPSHSVAPATSDHLVRAMMKYKCHPIRIPPPREALGGQQAQPSVDYLRACFAPVALLKTLFSTAFPTTSHEHGDIQLTACDQGTCFCHHCQLSTSFGRLIMLS